MKLYLFFLPLFLFATPAQVILISHAEGEHALTLKGQERAMALVPFFYGSPSVLSYGLPAALFADTASTLKPLADKLNLPVSSLPLHKVVKEVLENPDYEGKMLLICWQSSEIPQLARLLGAKKTPKWNQEICDRLWIFNFENQEKIGFKDVPQKLLYGDSPK